MARLVAILTAAGLLAGLGARVASAGDDGVAFFEQKIRPVLVQDCYGCHSAGAKKLKGGLKLDSREGLLAGGDSGPAVVVGKPDDSLLVQALRYDGPEMPPKGKLPEAVVRDFERWVRMGMPDPRAGQAAPARTEIDLEAGRQFWAYRPLQHHPAPAVQDRDWASNDIDRFILATLEARGLHPAGDAPRAALALRVSYDLIGLPLPPEEVDAFVADTAPDAYERLVDRLLASPRFGERWGRHWLDVVRFGESLTLRGFVLGSAWRYRDYVIDAFNADLPFDRFVREQIAGDLLPADSVAERRRQLVATALLALGNTNLEEQDKQQLRMDVVDEQLDTIGKAFLAQTIGCARCHDHKFDPIPTRDYYALAGILRNVKTLEHANVSQWIERPLPAEAAEDARLREHEKAVAALEAAVQAERKRLAAHRSRAAGAIAAGDLPGVVVDDADAKRVGDWRESHYVPTFVGRGYLHDDNAGKGEKSLTFQPELPEAGRYEVRLAYTAGTNRARAVPVTVFSADGEKDLKIDMREPPPIDGRFVSLGQYHFERNSQGYVLVANEGTDGHVVADAVLFVPAGKVPVPSPAPGKSAGASLRKREAELKRLRDDGPKRDTIVSVVEEAQIGDAAIHIRGSVHTLGPVVPRGFLQIASAGAPRLPSNESGRRELADWIAGADNPLTARVFVNRAWHWLFGDGLVRTMDNFGTTGEAPSHPELLDELALRFIEDGYSIKALVRRIVLSRTYRQAADGDPQAARVDPDNRLLWHRPRRRLDAECIRDTILCASGQLRQDMSGPAYPAGLKSDYGFVSDATCRSVYLPVFRNALPSLLEAFDVADPSLVVGRRNVSTVAPQSLFMLNNPFVIDQARRTAQRLLDDAYAGDEARLVRAYRLTLGREPTDAERRIGLRFVSNASDPEASWSLLVQALFASVDFRYCPRGASWIGPSVEEIGCGRPVAASVTSRSRAWPPGKRRTRSRRGPRIFPRGRSASSSCSCRGA